MTLGTSLAQSFTTFATSRHGCSWNEANVYICCTRRARKLVESSGSFVHRFSTLLHDIITCTFTERVLESEK